MIFTAYTLFKLQGDLVYESQVLSISDLSDASIVFAKLYLITGLTLLIGLGGLVFSLNKSNVEVIYVEKKRNDNIDDQGEEKEEQKSHTLDLNIIRDMVAKEADQLILAKNILTHLCKHIDAGIGAFYTTSKEDGKRMLEMKASYALALGESQTIKFEFGEGLVGQAALEQKTLIIDDIPEGYIKIVSGLGSATPTHLLIVPVKRDNELFGVVEIASFTELGKNEAEMVGAAFKLLTQKSAGGTKATKAEEGTTEKPTEPEAEEKKEKKSRTTKKGSNKA
ncbi:Two-component hybrid sensor and regulator [Fulvivirga imtechensis AK7]|uniref:Two-component hybrid sensor and regulator n=2 Tax=Fulvivirga TaxID=396811 RepID=L8JN85_9BACT|nr:Two-component hybrid sensor and regulator [Fulvivirga imtechensis AK7]